MHTSSTPFKNILECKILSIVFLKNKLEHCKYSYYMYIRDTARVSSYIFILLLAVQTPPSLSMSQRQHELPVRVHPNSGADTQEDNCEGAVGAEGAKAWEE